MPKESGLELQVGAFVVVAWLCLMAFVLSVSDFSFFEKGDEYAAIFSYANGLKKGAPVRLAGVDAGHVKDLTIYYDTTELRTKVKAGLWVTRGIGVPDDSRVLINQLGLLGEKYVEIMPGSSSKFLSTGSKLHGEDPVAMESIMAMVGSIAGKLDMTLANVNQRVLTEANTKALAETLQNLAVISASVKNGEGTLGKLFTDDGVYQNLSLTMANVAALTDKLNKGEGTIGKFLTDPSVYKNLDELSCDLKANPWKLFYRPKGK
ncbi:MAG: MCE family protein [Candidatus Omnitrophica bacterium]|nr:MCE family protein [Candidatus Omnitrophota bacterium]